MMDAVKLSVLAAATIVVAACVVEETEESRRFDDDGGGGATSTVGTMGAGAMVAVGGGASVSSSSSASVSSSTGSGSSCPDSANEPNDSEGNATFLGEIDDCDDQGGEVEGKLPDGDEDWFRYTGSDALSCSTDPTRTLDADGTVQICKYAEGVTSCDDLEVSCPDNATAATSPGGRSGCCSSENFDMSVDCNAFPGNAVADIYIRLVPAPTEACVTYTLQYHF